MELINIKHNLQIHCCSGQAVPGQITLCLCLNMRRVLSLRLWYRSVLPLDSNAKTEGGEQILFGATNRGDSTPLRLKGSFKALLPYFLQKFPKAVILWMEKVRSLKL